MRKVRVLASLASLSLALSGCGGGGGEGSGPSNPTSGPTGTTPSTVRFTASGVGPLAGTIFIDSNGDGTIQQGEGVTTTNLFGEFGQGIAGLLPPGGTAPAAATVRFEAFGPDTADGFIVSALRTPAGATVISPVTTIIDLVGDQASVRRAFGLSTAGMAIRDGTDLLRFDAAQKLNDADPTTASEAARVTAVNFRILASALLLSRFQGSPVDVGSGTGDEGVRYLAEVIKETGSADMTNKETILRALRKGNGLYPYSAEQLDVAAETFAEFMSTVPTSFPDLATAFRYELAFRFYALAKIKTVFAGYPSTDIASVRALTVDDMRGAVALFADTPRPVVGNSFYALPDYQEIRGTSLIPLAALTRNDVSAPPFGIGDFPKEVIGVSVDPKFNGRIAALLSSDGVRVDTATGFLGYVYFDYRIRSGGQESTARVHVFVRSN